MTADDHPACIRQVLAVAPGREGVECVLCEVVLDNGKMARVEDLRRVADEHQLPLVSIADLAAPSCTRRCAASTRPDIASSSTCAVTKDVASASPTSCAPTNSKTQASTR